MTPTVTPRWVNGENCDPVKAREYHWRVANTKNKIEGQVLRILQGTLVVWEVNKKKLWSITEVEYLDESPVEGREAGDKDAIIAVLKERLKAFANPFHKHEYTTLSDAITAVQSLVPPSYFPAAPPSSAEGESDAVGVLKWCTQQGFEPCGIDKWQQVYGPADDERVYTSEEVYQLFLKNQNRKS